MKKINQKFRFFTSSIFILRNKNAYYNCRVCGSIEAIGKYKNHCRYFLFIMSMYIIEKTGELVKCYNKDIALNSHNVVVVISQNQKKIYTWIGKNASAQSKFACARETARMRMETGYKIVTIEGDLTSNEFLEAVDESISESSGKMEHITMSSSSSRTTHKTTVDSTTTIQTNDTVKTKRTSETLERTSELKSVSEDKVESIIKELKNAGIKTWAFIGPEPGTTNASFIFSATFRP